MPAVLLLIVQAAIGTIATLIIAPRSFDPAANIATLWVLSFCSGVLSAIGLAATATYLSKQVRAISGVMVGILGGALCGAILALTLLGIDYSLIVYLALLAPALLAVLLAVLLDRSKSGWQS